MFAQTASEDRTPVYNGPFYFDLIINNEPSISEIFEEVIILCGNEVIKNSKQTFDFKYDTQNID